LLAPVHEEKPRHWISELLSRYVPLIHPRARGKAKAALKDMLRASGPLPRTQCRRHLLMRKLPFAASVHPLSGPYHFHAPRCLGGSMACRHIVCGALRIWRCGKKMRRVFWR
jgi:hypothetical protein